MSHTGRGLLCKIGKRLAAFNYAVGKTINFRWRPAFYMTMQHAVLYAYLGVFKIIKLRLLVLRWQKNRVAVENDTGILTVGQAAGSLPKAYMWLRHSVRFLSESASCI